MLYVLTALVFFFDAVFIHLLVCRKAKGGLLLRLFFTIAAVNLVICWGVFFVFQHYLSQKTGLLFTPLVFSATLIYILLVPTYLVFYFSTEQMSPSKKIMLLLQQRDLSLKELYSYFKDEEWIEPRINDLLLTGCLRHEAGRYELTPSGRSMAVLYSIYQCLLGRRLGG